jgi:hypothetical protein
MFRTYSESDDIESLRISGTDRYVGRSRSLPRTRIRERSPDLLRTRTRERSPDLLRTRTRERSPSLLRARIREESLNQGQFRTSRDKRRERPTPIIISNIRHRHQNRRSTSRRLDLELREAQPSFADAENTASLYYDGLVAEFAWRRKQLQRLGLRPSPQLQPGWRPPKHPR